MTLHATEIEQGIDIDREADVPGASPWLLAFRDDIRSSDDPPLAESTCGDMRFEIRKGCQSIWIIATYSSGAGIAFLPLYSPGNTFELSSFSEEQGRIECRVTTVLGEYRLLVELPHGSRQHLHWTTWLTPSEDLVLPFLPRDIYPLDASGNPLNTRGIVHAGQRGLKAGLLFFSLTRPASGSVFYLQNFTTLNDYFAATHSSPNDRVGGTWPELGFSLSPTREGSLHAGTEVAISDAFILFSPDIPTEEQEVARLFLDLYARMYCILPKPEAIHRHWPRRIAETIRDLTHSPECAARIDDECYLLAYVGADDRPPESMVQLAVLVPMIEYTEWSGESIPLIDELRRNLPSFYNPELKTVTRWLPSMPYEKHREMDSWYLYHTYLNLSRLALEGDETCRRLFLDSIEFGMRVARQFNYRWPVFYDPATLEVLRQEARPGVPGELDVGGLYALVMLQALELTGEDVYLQEAINAAQALKGLGFSLGYQFNNTAFGAGALLRLWQLTGDEQYRDLSHICMANIFHNIWLWECDYGHARHYHTFMGLPPLHDGCYLALYEELEVMAAFHAYVRIAGDIDAIPGSIRLLMAEYCKYMIDRAWYHYPSELPADMLADEPKSGHINRSLSFPLEDLYDGWQKAGEVGQEIYGCAAPFAISARHCMRVPGTDFLIHCNYPTIDLKLETTKFKGSKRRRTMTFRIMGDPRCHCHVRVVSELHEPLPAVDVSMEVRGKARSFKGVITEEGYLEYQLPGSGAVTVTWEEQRRGKTHTTTAHMVEETVRKKPVAENNHSPKEAKGNGSKKKNERSKRTGD